MANMPGKPVVLVKPFMASTRIGARKSAMSARQCRAPTILPPITFKVMDMVKDDNNDGTCHLGNGQ
jgi:hypothetical protein